LSSEHAAALALLMEQQSRRDVRRVLAQEGSARAALARRSRHTSRKIAQLLQQTRERGISLLAADEAGFPARLKNIPDPPLLLYLRGNQACLNLRAVAVIGARRASLLGRETASTLARTLAGSGLAVVSGLALGIDSAAHEGALDAQGAGGTTLAVLGSGLGCVAPVTNLPLARRIVVSGGLLISEYGVTTRPRPHHFPERNRLISALAEVVVVVEAGDRSGSLITARLALEQGREVLAVPGAITQPNSRGVNRLLKQGAGLVDSAQDVLDAFGVQPLEESPAAARPGLQPEAQLLLEAMREAVNTIDELCEACELPLSQILALLAQLELAGFVARAGGGYIRRPL